MDRRPEQRIHREDRLTFATVPVGIVLVSLLACLVPPMQATRVDPVDVLRSE